MHLLQGHNSPFMVDSCQMDGLARMGAHGILRTTTKAALRTGVSRTLVKKKSRTIFLGYIYITSVICFCPSQNTNTQCIQECIFIKIQVIKHNLFHIKQQPNGEIVQNGAGQRGILGHKFSPAMQTPHPPAWTPPTQWTTRNISLLLETPDEENRTEKNQTQLRNQKCQNS